MRSTHCIPHSACTSPECNNFLNTNVKKGQVQMQLFQYLLEILFEPLGLLWFVSLGIYSLPDIINMSLSDKKKAIKFYSFVRVVSVFSENRFILPR